MTKIRYKTLLTNLTRGEMPVHRFCVLHNGTICGDTVYAVVSQKSGIPVPLVKATLAMIFDAIIDKLRHGYRIELPNVSAFLSMLGSPESTSAESRRANRPVLVAHLAAKGGFKTCCQGPEFELENVSQGATVVVGGVSDNVSRMQDVLTNGTDVEVHAIGSGLYMPDPADPTVGAYIADSQGKVLVKATVAESTATSLVCTFAQIDLEEGTYKFCVASRNGLDPELYGVTVGRRNVQVVNAASAEEGEVSNG